VQRRSHSHIVSGTIKGEAFTRTARVRLTIRQMLKHGRAGVPMEVMGLMLGEFVDEYTVQVVDVFAMPQSGTTVTVESVDHVFQTKMLDMLKQTGR
jgi:26S proteasome regulatory subunit N11